MTPEDFIFNPYELRGPEFLALYIVLLLTGFLAALGLRFYLRGPRSGFPTRPPALDPYEIAYLAGGERMAIDAALVSLVQRNVLAVDSQNGSLMLQGALPTGAHYLERTLYATAKMDSIVTVSELRAAGKAAVESLSIRLRTLGLMLSDEKFATFQLVPAVVMIGVALFGSVKILIGLARDRPVGFLVMLCLLTGIIALVFWSTARRARRTPYGDYVLRQLKADNAALEYTAKARPDALGGADLALALGLFGMGALAFTDGPMANLKHTLNPPVSASSSYSSSSCSSSSSCGSSCGGGCGGGCGGCGG